MTALDVLGWGFTQDDCISCGQELALMPYLKNPDTPDQKVVYRCECPSCGKVNEIVLPDILIGDRLDSRGQALPATVVCIECDAIVNTLSAREIKGDFYCDSCYSKLR